MPYLNEDIKNNLSKEDFYLYNRIIEFFYIEYKLLNTKINEGNKSNNIQNQLYLLKENIYFRKYKNIFTNIYNIENEKSQNNLKIILNKKNKLDELRNECDILFNDINSGALNLENVKEKFEKIIEKIELFQGEKNNDNNINRINTENKFNNIKSIQKEKNELLKSYNNINLNEEQKDPETTKNFVEFYHFYNPLTLSTKLNNTFTHNFFNYKKIMEIYNLN